MEDKTEVNESDPNKDIVSISDPKEEKLNTNLSPSIKNEKSIVENEILKKNINTDIKLNNENAAKNRSEVKPKKEIPIEKKPFDEFINNYLIPSLVKEFKDKGFEIVDINLQNTIRPITDDKCWVIFCSIKNTCNFWLSFEKNDICSLKSISLSKPNQKPSIIESFLIDEKRITLKLIISRIMQRLNGQKLIGVN